MVETTRREFIVASGAALTAAALSISAEPSMAAQPIESAASTPMATGLYRTFSGLDFRDARDYTVVTIMAPIADVLPRGIHVPVPRPYRHRDYLMDRSSSVPIMDHMIKVRLEVTHLFRLSGDGCPSLVPIWHRPMTFRLNLDWIKKGGITMVMTPVAWYNYADPDFVRPFGEDEIIRGVMGYV